MSDKNSRLSRYQNIRSEIDDSKGVNQNKQENLVVDEELVASPEVFSDGNNLDVLANFMLDIEETEIASVLKSEDFAEELYSEDDNIIYEDDVTFENSENPTDLSGPSVPGDTTMINELVSVMDKDESYVEATEPQVNEEIDLIVKQVLGNMDEPVVLSSDPLKTPLVTQIYEGKLFEITDEHELKNDIVAEEENGKKKRFGKKKKKSENGEDADNGYYTKGLKEKSKSSGWHKFGIGFFTFCNICALICFFVAYGPFNYVRDLFVTTAMRTMSHKYLANVLYSTETIQEILANNVTLEPNEIMDENAIKIGQIKEPEVYSSIYEEMVLKRNEGNDLYKVVKLDEHGYKGYVVFVYDPTKIELAVTRHLGESGEYVTSMAKRTKAHVAINGGGFLDYGGQGSGGYPTGYVIKNGKIVWTRKRGGAWKGGTIGFNQEGVLMLLKERGSAAVKKGVYNGVDFGPFLIVNGKSAEVKGNGGWGLHPRTVIGQRQDGIVVMLIIDGRQAGSIGVDLNVAIDIMERFNVYNAANLDGGASTVLAVEGKLVNKPVAWSSSGERGVPTAWVVVD